MDDIVVWGRTREEQDARLKRALATFRRCGLKLNKKKCVFGVTELTYLGENLTHQGIKPDPDKVAGICNIPVPTTKEDVQRALGMLNYMIKFVPNLTVKTTALRQLLLEKKRPAVGSRIGKRVARNNIPLHDGTTPEVL